MSTSYIPPKVKLLLFGRAAGRCEYRGCNAAVTEDDLTRTDGNFSAFAHIVADSPGGPRGHETRSEALKADITNLMVLCLTHHKLIDVDALDAHPEEVLVGMKAEHETRIAKLTAINGLHRTQILMMQGNIGSKKAIFEKRLLHEAVLPKYPAGDLFEINLAHLSLDDGDAVYWAAGVKDVERKVSTLHERLLADPEAERHVSVFAIAPIPLLMTLGRCLGEVIQSDIRQNQREPDGEGFVFADNPWRWAAEEDGVPEVGEVQVDGDPSARRIGLVLSISGRGLEARAREHLGADAPIYLLGLEHPHLEAVRHRGQLQDFRRKVRAFLGNVRGHHRPDAVVHVFPALPNSLAIEFGRVLLPKVDLEMHVHDPNRFQAGFAVPLVLLGPMAERAG